MSEFDPLKILAQLEHAGVRYVVIGGIAARLAGAPVVTSDLDIVPQKDGHNIELLLKALAELDATFRIGEIETDATISKQTLEKNNAIQASTKAGNLDIIFEPAGTSGYEDLARSSVQTEVTKQLVIEVAALADVIRSKEAANRLKDQGQLPILRATLEELRRNQS